jgi:hypothetical protein
VAGLAATHTLLIWQQHTPYSFYRQHSHVKDACNQSTVTTDTLPTSPVACQQYINNNAVLPGGLNRANLVYYCYFYHYYTSYCLYRLPGLEPERSAQLISITSSRAQLGCADVRECLCMQAQPCRQVPYNHHTSKNNTEKLPLLLPETPIQL